MLFDTQSSYSQQPAAQNGHGLYVPADYSNANGYDNKEEEPMYRYASSRLTGQSSHSTSKTPSVQTSTVKSPYSVQPTHDHHSHSSHPSVATPKNEAQQGALMDPLFAELDAMSYPQQSTSSNAPPVNQRTSMPYQPQANHGQHQMGSTDMFMSSSNAENEDFYFDQYDRDHQLLGQNDVSPGPPSFREQHTNPFINHANVLSDSKLTNDNQLIHTEDGNNLPQNGNKDQKRQVMWNKLQQTTAKVSDKNIKKREVPARGKGTTGANSTSTTYAGKRSSQSPQNLSHRPIDSNPPNYIERNIGMIKNKENYFHRIPDKKYQNIYAKRKGLHSGNDTEYDQSSSSQSTLPLTINLNTGNQGQISSIPTIVEIPIDGDMNHNRENLSVDINLRLLDPQNASQQHEHAQQQFTDHSNSEQLNWSATDVLDRHIRKMERSIHQNLPPTHSSQRHPPSVTTNTSSLTGTFSSRSTGLGYSGYSSRNHTKETYSYSARGLEEDSYLAQMHQSRKPKDFQQYTLRDYDRFKKNCGFGTGHLGFDSENITYKEKLEKANKAKEYAQQVEARNRKIISEATIRMSSETRSPTEDSKTSRLTENAHLSKRTLRYPSKSTHSSPISMTEIIPFAPTRRPVDVSSYRTPPMHQVPSARRPAEILSQPPSARRPVGVTTHSPTNRRLVEVVSQASSNSKQRVRFPQHEEHEIVEIVNRSHERDVTPVNRSFNHPQKKRRELNDENDSQHGSVTESLSSHRTSVRRLSPAKVASPSSRISSENGSQRRPLRFESLVPVEEPTYIVRERTHSIQPHKRKSSNDQNEQGELEDDVLMKVIRDELTERPLQEGEELVIVE
ncbi:unnamed protein product [Adineta ricciae]|uniref:Uncharacterized protein n=1 Tax=Adineta ricciae TaxID=249248 RepID=A0A814HGW6_ADIRI|nr:unnamed protein product [Adineta ricciae]CAF1010695.1 unnamed protein product [Adineta ricciae]